MESTCTASDACREAGKSRRATAVGVDVEDEERLLGDGVGGEAASAAAGERSLANLPDAEAEPNALLAAVGCCCWCSGVDGSDDTPGLLGDGLRMLLSGVCISSSRNSLSEYHDSHLTHCNVM